MPGKMGVCMRKLACQIVVCVVLPVLVGMIIYLVFRPHNILFNTWLDRMGIEIMPYGQRVPLIQLPGNPLTNWLRFSLPDGLWIFAFANAVLLVWMDAKMQWRLFIAGVLGAFYIVYEMGQAFGVFSGTFDLLDIVTCLVALAASMILKMGKGDCDHAMEIKGH